MKVAWVLPYVHREIGEECIARCRMEHLLLVDNTETNWGVMRSHNHGIDFARTIDADWFVTLSAAVRFGEPGGTDFERHLGRSAGCVTVSGVDFYGWHCFAYSREVIEAIGRFDENFSPYGFDDVDMSIRIHKAFPDGTWSRVQVDGSDREVGMGHSVHVSGVACPAPPLIAYLAKKWGEVHGHPFEDYFDLPFGPQTTRSEARGRVSDLRYWPPPGNRYPLVQGARWDEALPLPANASVR